MIGLRNDHEYQGEPWEFKRLRHRDQADERHAVDSYDLPTDRQDEYAPVPWWAIDPSFKTCAAPVPALARSRKNTAESVSFVRGDTAGDKGAAVGLGGTCPPVAPTPHRRAA